LNAKNVRGFAAYATLGNGVTSHRDLKTFSAAYKVRIKGSTQQRDADNIATIGEMPHLLD
jgi:hypothetical protein